MWCVGVFEDLVLKLLIWSLKDYQLLMFNRSRRVSWSVWESPNETETKTLHGQLEPGLLLNTRRAASLFNWFITYLARINANTDSFINYACLLITDTHTHTRAHNSRCPAGDWQTAMFNTSSSFLQNTEAKLRLHPDFSFVSVILFYLCAYQCTHNKRLVIRIARVERALWDLRFWDWQGLNIVQCVVLCQNMQCVGLSE